MVVFAILFLLLSLLLMSISTILFTSTSISVGSSQVVLGVKNLVQETQETRVRSLGLEDPLEEGMATHSSILAWRIPWSEEPGGLQSMGLQRVRHN